MYLRASTGLVGCGVTVGMYGVGQTGTGVVGDSGAGGTGVYGTHDARNGYRCPRADERVGVAGVYGTATELARRTGDWRAAPACRRVAPTERR